jgi:hypothetical protein
MKPKQLANVLTRILGLSLCAHGVPSLIMNAIYGVGFSNNGRGNFSMMMPQLIVGLLPLAVGIFLIVRSRWVTEKLFSDEAE